MQLLSPTIRFNSPLQFSSNNNKFKRIIQIIPETDSFHQLFTYAIPLAKLDGVTDVSIDHGKVTVTRNGNTAEYTGENWWKAIDAAKKAEQA